MGSSIALQDELDRLMAARCYDGFVTLYRERRDGVPPLERRLYDGDFARACMVLRLFDEAVEAATRAEEATARSLASNVWPDAIAACEWALGERAGAIARWRKTCRAIGGGRVRSTTDVGGGVESGLLLWFAASVARDDVARAEAVSFLQERWTRLREMTRDATGMGCAPIARVVLGEITEDDARSRLVAKPTFVHSFAEDGDRWDEVATVRLALLSLVIGARAIERGDVRSAAKAYADAAALPPSANVTAWCLARHESECAAGA